MKTLQEIKDDYAKEFGNQSFSSMIREYGITHVQLDQIAKRYAEACCKATLEKAAGNGICYYDHELGADLDKESILDSSNIVLL